MSRSESPYSIQLGVSWRCEQKLLYIIHTTLAPPVWVPSSHHLEASDSKHPLPHHVVLTSLRSTALVLADHRCAQARMSVSSPSARFHRRNTHRVPHLAVQLEKPVALHKVVPAGTLCLSSRVLVHLSVRSDIGYRCSSTTREDSSSRYLRSSGILSLASRPASCCASSRDL